MSQQQESEAPPKDETLPKFTGFRQTIKLELHGEHVDFGVVSVESAADRVLDSEQQPFTRQLSLGQNPLTLASLGCDAFVTDPGVLCVRCLSRSPSAVVWLRNGASRIRVRPAVPAVFEIESTAGWSVVADGNAPVPTQVVLFPR